MKFDEKNLIALAQTDCGKQFLQELFAGCQVMQTHQLIEHNLMNTSYKQGQQSVGKKVLEVLHNCKTTVINTTPLLRKDK